MKLTLRKIFLLIILIAAFNCSQAQRFDSILAKLNTEYKQEKLYLHFDRSLYSPGETIWFKAYLFTGNYPSLISKTIYAELLDEKGKVIDRKTAPVLSSSAASSFDLPATLKSTVVYVRAYTKWMLNFDSAFIFSKAIAVTPAVKTDTKLPANTSTTAVNKSPIATATSLQFFPEGGDLVEGIESKVAFKANNRNGLPVDVKGDITDIAGKKITSFVSTHDGMGIFSILPQKGQSYKAIWKDNAGVSRETLLPAAKQNGIVLEVNSNFKQVEFKVKRADGSAPLYPFVYVVAQMNQQLLYRAKANMLKNSVASSLIPTDNFPTGIVQITLFTPDEKPIAERIVFVNQFTGSFITDINTALKDMGKKKKNVIQVDVPDTISCNLSISVTDADLNPMYQSDNIYSRLLLTGDIKGYVHNPAYYFSGEADSLIDHLDLVMLTNGWRRFNWEKVLANQFPPRNYLPENYLVIQGQVQGLSRTLLANKELNAIIELKNKKREFMSTTVEPGGKFVFPDMVFYDTAKLFYQFNNDKKKDLTSRATFEIKNNLLRSPLLLKPDSVLNLDIVKADPVTLSKNIEVNKEQLSELEMLKVKTLKEVVVTTKAKTKQEKMDEEYTSGFFSGGESRSFLPEDDPYFLSSGTVLQYLQGRVAGMQVSIDGGTPTVTWRGATTVLFMNEMETEAEVIQSLPMSDVAMIKVFNPPFFGATRGGSGGAVAVYLKKGVTLGNSSVKGLDNTVIAGYSPVKEFYSPDYSNQNAFDSSDFRKTLYWNPFVITDKTHRRIFLNFYNNDLTKRMRIIIEGCNEEGKLTRMEKIIQ
jgi:hypothetical protein